MDELDRWTRVLPLGSGAFGEVHLAWDTQTREWVALKRFTGQDELGLLRFVIESRIRVSHPHLVRTLAFRLVDDRAWLVTELARGGSVRALMARTGALPWGWVAELVDQVLSALVALHATGVVHRDLKPANLLLQDGGAGRPHVLVGDFGIATWRTVSMTGVGAAIGTPGYLAPEYLDGQQPAPATDLFALGVLAAELLAGSRLVHYSNATPVLPSTWNDVLPVPAGVPAQLAAVLRRMADPDPRRRYVDCTEAREALLVACPPSARGDMTAVTVQDLLAALPPGWTSGGPESADAPTAVTAAVTAASTPAEHVGPGWATPPIDGGPTALVDQSTEPTATAPPENGSAAPPQTPAGGIPAAANGSAAAPNPAHGSATPPSGAITPLATPPGGSAISTATPASGSAIPMSTPPRGAAAPTPAPAGGPATSPGGQPTGVGDKAAAKAARKARRRRKAKRATIAVVALAVLVGAATLWWAATHRSVAGQALPGGSVDNGEVRIDWVPVVLGECKPVDIGRERAGGTERCQHTQRTDSAQSWVIAPPGGFPVSDPGGPFPGEECADDEPTYSPVGDRVRCTAGKWEKVD